MRRLTIASLLILFFLRGLVHAAGINSSLIGPSTLYTGLAAWWSFDGNDLTPNGFTDLSGNGRTAFLGNYLSTTSALVAGKSGQAVNFQQTATNGLGVLSDAIGSGAMTISAWLYATAYINASTIINNDASPRTTCEINSPQDGSIACSNDGDSHSAVTLAGAVPLRKWTHFVAVRDGSGNYTFYINGVQNNSASQPAGTPDGSGVDTVIGLRRDQTLPWPGSIDDVRIYNRDLSPQEIVELYNTTAGAKVNTSMVGPQGLNSGLVGWWTFDGANMVTNVKDSSGQGNNGFMQGWTSTSSAVVLGKMGQALSFNGSNSFISLPSISGVQSVSFWTKPSTLTQSITDFNGSQTVDISAGTVRGNSWGSPTVYIDGQPTPTFPDTRWHYVAITTATPFTANAFKIGKISSTFYSGQLDDVRVYNRVLTAQEITQLYRLAH